MKSRASRLECILGDTLQNMLRETRLVLCSCRESIIPTPPSHFRHDLVQYQACISSGVALKILPLYFPHATPTPSYPYITSSRKNIIEVMFKCIAVLLRIAKGPGSISARTQAVLSLRPFSQSVLADAKRVPHHTFQHPCRFTIHRTS